LVITPATPRVAKDYILDRRDLKQTVPPVPAHAQTVARNASWRLDSRCE
jgi:hypothetical protein